MLDYHFRLILALPYAIERSGPYAIERSELYSIQIKAIIEIKDKGDRKCLSGKMVLLVRYDEI